MSIGEYPITITIVAITVVVSMLAFRDSDLKYKWLFYPYKIQRNHNESYRIFSHIFIHADTMHLLFNMFVFYSFGSLMEVIFINYFGKLEGSIYFVLLYVLGGIAASIWPFIRNKNNPNYLSLGASGAVAAVLFACILWIPDSGIYVFFIPISIPAWLFGILYLGFEFYMSKKEGDSIAHDAHFGGAIFGIVYILFINFEKGIDFISYIFN